jgi:hypothetical protein
MSSRHELLHGSAWRAFCCTALVTCISPLLNSKLCAPVIVMVCCCQDLLLPLVPVLAAATHRAGSLLQTVDRAARHVISAPARAPRHVARQEPARRARTGRRRDAARAVDAHELQRQRGRALREAQWRSTDTIALHGSSTARWNDAVLRMRLLYVRLLMQPAAWRA